MMQDETPDPILGAELRQSSGAEWAAEAAEDERLTELHRRRRMTLADIGKELANRSDRVSVEFAGHKFSGVVVGAGEDYLTIAGSGQIAEVRTRFGQWAVLDSDGPRVERIEAPSSFRASLHQHAAAETMLRLTLPGGELLIGKIAVVAEDHIELTDTDGRGVYVPMNLIAGLIRSNDFQ